MKREEVPNLKALGLMKRSALESWIGRLVKRVELLERELDEKQ